MRILQFIAAIVLFFATPAMAKEGGPAAWIVSQKSGHVQVVRAGMQPASVQLRASLSPGDVVATGADGRAMLTRGGDYVIVAPGSRLPASEERTAKRIYPSDPAGWHDAVQGAAHRRSSFHRGNADAGGRRQGD